MFDFTIPYSYKHNNNWVCQSVNTTLYCRDAQIPGAWSPRRLNFVLLRLIFVSLQYGICFVTLLVPRILRWLLDSFQKIVHPCCTDPREIPILQCYTAFVMIRHKYQSAGLDSFSFFVVCVVCCSSLASITVSSASHYPRGITVQWKSPFPCLTHFSKPLVVRTLHYGGWRKLCAAKMGSFI